MVIRIAFSDAEALSDPARFAAAYAAVPAARREKVDRLRAPAAKRLSLAAGALLTQTLTEEGVGAEEMEFALGPFGKPYLPLCPDVQFSLSHSGERVMCVVADRAVGCDIQVTTRRELRVAERFFSAPERDFVFAPPDEKARLDRFYRIWTLKESFLKCTGLGLSLPMDAFSAVPGEGGIVLTQSVDDGRYTLSEPDGGEGYRCACCVRGD